METDAGITVTVRLIRSFQHRNIKHLVFHHLSRDITVKEFMTRVREELKTRPGLPPPFRTYSYDTMKIECKAHGSKTNDPVINKMDDGDLILKPGQTLRASGLENETEVSFFKLEDYDQYKKDSTTVW